MAPVGACGEGGPTVGVVGAGRGLDASGVETRRCTGADFPATAVAGRCRRAVARATTGLGTNAAPGRWASWTTTPSSACAVGPPNWKPGTLSGPSASHRRNTAEAKPVASTARPATRARSRHPGCASSLTASGGAAAGSGRSRLARRRRRLRLRLWSRSPLRSQRRPLPGRPSAAATSPLALRPSPAR